MLYLALNKKLSIIKTNGKQIFIYWANHKSDFMAQSVSCQLSVRKTDFDSSLGDKIFLVEKVILRPVFSRICASSVFTFLDLTHLNTQTTGSTPLYE
jgi:hypothetical protein